MQKKVPRYVLISFSGNKTGLYREFDSEARTGLVSQNKSNINPESHMTTNFFLTARFQDESIREKIMTQVLRLADLSQIDLSSAGKASQSDVSKAVDAVTGDYISKDVLLDLVHDELFKLSLIHI